MKVHILINTTALALIAGSVVTYDVAAQSDLRADSNQSRRGLQQETSSWFEQVGNEQILVEGTVDKIKQPANGYSSNRVAEQQWRKDFREQLDWANLSDSHKQALNLKAVGPDQIDNNGVNLVSFAWSYTKSVRGDDHIANDIVLNYDGDVVIVGSDLGNDNSDLGFSRLFVTEIDGSANANQGWTENWERAPYYTFDDEDGYVSGERGAVDFRGNTYTCGFRSDGRFNVWKFDGETGSTIWSKNGTITNGSDAIATDIETDPEGAVYVSGHYTKDADGERAWFIARLNPDTGNIDWIQEPPVNGEVSGGIEFDRKGDLFIGGFGNAGILIAKLRASDGGLVWNRVVPTADASSGFIDTLKLDPNGDAYFSGRRDGFEGGWITTKWDGETGDTLWTQSADGGRVKNMEVDDLGNVYVCGSAQTRTFRLIKYDTNGNFVWDYITGTTGVATDVALDRLGNVYMSGEFGDSNPKVMTSKHDPADGSLVWEMIDNPSRPNEDNIKFAPKDLLVDAGGNVYVAGWRRSENDSGLRGDEFFVIKYEQPYLSIPLITRSYPQVSVEGRSVWDPDGSLGIDGFSYEEDLFTLISSDVISRSQINDRLDAKVDYGIGVIEGGVKLREFSGRVDVSFQADVSAGNFDASTTGELAIAVPAETDILAGNTFDITLNWDPDEFATDLLSNLEPKLEAGIYASASLNIDADLDIDKGNGTNIVNTGIVNGDVSYDDLSMFGIDFINLPPGGVWYDPVSFPWSRFFSGKVRSPILETEGVFNENTGVIQSTLRQKFFDGKIRVTELLLAYFGQGPLSFNWSPSGGSPDFNADVDAGLIQADIDGRLYLLQDLDLEIRPYVRLEFSTDGDVTPDDVYLNFFDPNNGNPVEQRTHTVRMPDNGELEVTPYFGAQATLVNSSGIEIELEAGFDVARFEASASALGVDLISIDKCIGCVDETISWEVRTEDLGININEEFMFPNEHQLSSIQIFGDTDLQPQLIGASRISSPMRIYNQRNPSLEQFNAMASGTTPMVLYGYKFTSNSNTKVKIEHHGRTENLERNRLNEQAILVEIPNRFFLLPGIARIWVTNNNGVSESIDLAIEYPFPNFEGLEEVYWASDIRWAQEPTIVIDGGTPAGNDSFIARRDYYEYMQNQLWNPGILSDLSNPNQTAEEYFTTFSGWNQIGVEPSTPGFPSVVMDGVSLPRNQLVVPNGKLQVDVAEELVARSGRKEIVLCNPGPGGGMSRTWQAVVPAPRPVISEVSPDVLLPGELELDSEGKVRMSIRGPVTVPFFDGYEAPKYGNFTPRSTVYIDGNPVETEFINSGELIARAPSAAFSSFGRRVVDVRTPNAKGIGFTENLIDGNGVDQGESFVGSGGVSEPYMVEMFWPTPEVEFVSHTELVIGTPPLPAVTIDDAPAVDDHNITLEGKNFAPNCKVFVDGIAIPTTRDTSSIVRATLDAENISRLGTVRVWVGNPPPSVRTSDPVNIVIIAESQP